MEAYDLKWIEERPGVWSAASRSGTLQLRLFAARVRDSESGSHFEADTEHGESILRAVNERADWRQKPPTIVLNGKPHVVAAFLESTHHERLARAV